MKKKLEKQSEEDIAWRKGYEMGMQTILHQEEAALRIGRAILEALDDRYQYRQEDI